MEDVESGSLPQSRLMRDVVHGGQIHACELAEFSVLNTQLSECSIAPFDNRRKMLNQ